MTIHGLMCWEYYNVNNKFVINSITRLKNIYVVGTPYRADYTWELIYVVGTPYRADYTWEFNAVTFSFFFS